MGLTQCGVCKPLTASNPMFGVRRLSLNRYRIGCRVDAQHRADSTSRSTKHHSRTTFGPSHLNPWNHSLPKRSSPQAPTVALRIHPGDRCELPSRRSVGIDTTLDLGDAFVVAVNHRCDGDRAPYEDGNDRDQKRAQAYDGIEQSIHPPPSALAKFSGGADRDRTGGLLVANQALSQLSYSPIPQWSASSGQQTLPTTSH